MQCSSSSQGDSRSCRRDGSCSDEEEEAEGALDAAGSADPVGAALVQLAKLVKDMQKQKKDKKNKSLDNLPLRSTRAWGEDFRKIGVQQRRCQVSQPCQISACGWLEHRSRVQGYQASVRFGWLLVRIWGCLRLGQREEARARAALHGGGNGRHWWTTMLATKDLFWSQPK